MNQPEPCPFVDAKGKKCKGHIVRIEAFKADLAWHRSDEGKWTFSVGEPRTHYHLYCSEKGNHAGFNKPDSEKMKFYYRDLPPTLQKVITTPDQASDQMPDPDLDKDLSGLSDETLVRDLIISHVVLDELTTSGAIEDLGHAKAIIRELMERGWTKDEIIEQANNAPWVDRALQMVDEAMLRDKAKKPRRK